MQSFENLEEMFDLITNHSMLGISVIQDNSIKYANKRFLNYIGYTWEEIEATNSNELFDHIFYSEDSKRVKEISSKNQKGELKTTTHLQLRIIKKRNEIAWLEIYAKSIMYQGRPAGMNISMDITERKQVEIKLKESEEKYRSLIQGLTQTGIGIDIVKTDYKIIYQNPVLKERFGDVAGKLCFELYMGRRDPCDFCPMIKAVKSKIVQSVELVGKDGRNYELISAPFVNPDGMINKTVEVIIDITERKTAEETLRQSEEKYRNLVETTSDWIWEVDNEGKYTYSSPKVEELLGFKPEEIIGKTPFDLMPYEESKRVSKFFQENTLSLTPFDNLENTSIHKNGQLVTLETSAVPLFDSEGNFVGYRGIDRDITERVKAQNLLKESEERFRTLFEVAPASIVVSDLNSKILLCNQKFCDLHGVKNKDFVIGRKISEFIAKRELATISEAIEISLRGEPRSIIQYTMLREDGTEFLAEATSSPIRNEIGEIIGLIGIAQDISERIIAEQKLRESEEHFRSITEQSLFGIFIIQQGKLKYVNQGVSNINGYTVDEMLNWTGLDIAKTIYSDDLENIMNRLRRSEEGDLDEKSSSVFRVITKRGKLKWVEEYNKRIDFEGEPASLVTLIDITSKIESELKLKKSESKYRHLFNILPISVSIFDLKGNLVESNKVIIKKLAEYADLDFVGQNYVDIIPYFQNVDQLLQLFRDRLKAIRKGENPEPVELMLVSKAGKRVWLYWESSRIEIEGETFSQVLIQDITERKNAEEKLIESEEKYRMLFEGANDAIFLLDRYTFVDTNDYILKMYGYEKKSQLIGLKPWEVSPRRQPDGRDSKEKAIEMMNKSLEGEPQRFYWKHIKEDGNLFDTEVSLNRILIENKYFLQAIVRDITERKVAEQQLKESEEKYKVLVERSLQGIIINQEGRFVFANSAMAKISGYSVEELLSLSTGDILRSIHPDDRDMAIGRFRDRLEGKSVPSHYEYRIIRKDGEVRWVELYSTVIEYEGKIASQQAFIDVTERKKAEKKVKESEEKFRTIAEQSSIGIGILQDNLIKYLNRGLVDMFGYSVDEMLNWPPNGFIQTIYPDDRELVIEQARKKQQGLPDYLERYQFRGLTKSGEVIWIDNFTKSIMYEGKSADLVTFVDITGKKEAEQESIKLNKLKSDLLRRTSHELKTPLVSIKGFTNLLLELHRKKFDYQTVSIIEEIKGGCERLEGLIKDLLDTSNLESDQILLNTTYEDLAFLLKFCVKELDGLIKERNHNISVELHDSLMTRFEKEKIYEVIFNLLSNAIKYTPRGGKIKIKSEVEDNFYVISISDNGIGFTSEEKGEIFKQFGKIERYGQGLDIISEGTGLGLYISKKIVELHEGDIWVESEGRNKGSTFYFSLPITLKKPD